MENAASSRMDPLQPFLQHPSALQIGWLSCSVYQHDQYPHSDIASASQASMTNSSCFLGSVTNFESGAIAIVAGPAGSAAASRS